MARVVIFFVLVSLSVQSQNWNVFNKNYRYNYKFNNSQLISNVLFADTVKQTGADTTYIMNNIGVVTGSILTTNQPQFLEKKIIKLANGNVLLQTTNALTIVPTCSLNQTWLFDAINNHSASCVSIATETVFSIVDSIKTILINNTDSIKLSKSFGLIQYPKLYAQNAYYRLVGIEDGTKYDTVSLFGEKVPNAWDFYDYKIGQGLCTYFSYMYGGAPLMQGCTTELGVVTSKTVSSAGYIYFMKIKTITSNNSSPCDPNINGPFVNTGVNYSCSSKGLPENRMYPGMVMGDAMYPGLVTFTGTNQAITMKTKGPDTFTTSFISNNTYAATYTLTSYNTRILGYRIGVGLAIEVTSGFEFMQSYGAGGCGTLNIGLGEINPTIDSKIVYPNPANSSINIPVDNCKLFIYDVFGKAILIQQIENKRSVDVSELPNGIYFIELQTESANYSQKLIIQH